MKTIATSVLYDQLTVLLGNVAQDIFIVRFTYMINNYGSFHRSFRRGSGVHHPSEKRLRRSRGSRSDRLRPPTLECRVGDRRRSNSVLDGSLTLHSTRYRHEDSCSTCSSSSDSEEEGFFLGQRIALPPQLTGEERAAEGQTEDEDKSRRGSFRRRTQSLGRKDKDKDKNCILS
ncbi:prickle-like protein 1 [Sinocyclocheilus grahami]|uniref:prickle-like protein 1 n=1 Tax=Sinocyclocheilus grahami TaxID=75366 RepID=UPI0007AD52B6|nr:PREDICTED: prickle-like protein 1 [Sinocyclocheilus grahami]